MTTATGSRRGAKPTRYDDGALDAGGGRKLAMVPLDALNVDERYQRVLQESRVRAYAKDFKPALLGTLDVSYREDGTLWVWDGQHRVALLRRMGWTHAACVLHYGMTPRDEAIHFVEAQLGRRTVSALERFGALLFAEDETALAVDAIVRERGFRVDLPREVEALVAEGQQRGRRLRAIDQTLAAYRRVGADGLRDVLDVLALWPDDPKATLGNLVAGLGVFFERHAEHFTGKSRSRHLDRLHRQLRDQRPGLLIADATARTSGSGGGGGGRERSVADVLEDRYDAGLRSEQRLAPDRAR